MDPGLEVPADLERSIFDASFQFLCTFHFSDRNETEIRSFFAVGSCVQLSPDSKEAEWTIYSEDFTLKRDHVSMVTPEGILLMGGYNSKEVTLVKRDGNYQTDVFSLNRFIEYIAFLQQLLDLI